MKITRYVNCVAAGMLVGILCFQVAAQVPPTPKQPVVDVYFGKQVTDNYRWLENIKDKPVQDWFKTQHDYTDSILSRIPGRDSLIQTLLYYNSLRSASYSDITRKAGRYFYKKTLPNEIVGKLYYREAETGKEILLYDAGLNDKGQPQSITFFVPSEDGKTIAFGIATGGAEISTMCIMDVDSKKLYPEKIYPTWGDCSWSPDSKSFIYTPMNSGDNTSMNLLLDTRSMYHIVGTDTSADKELFSRKKYPALGAKPEDECIVGYTEDYRYIIAYLSTVCNDLNCFYAPATELLNPMINWKRLFKKEDHVTSFVARGDDIYLLTYTNAPQYKILKTSFGNVDVSTASTIIPEGKDKIDNMSRCKDYLYYKTTDGINSHLYRYGFSADKIDEIPLPFSGSAGVSPFDIKTNDALVFVTSWTIPYTAFDYLPAKNGITKSAFNTAPAYPGVEDIVVEEREVPSHDGVMVPLSLMYNKHLKKDGSAICYMTGYGAYGYSATPYLSILSLALLNKGVIVAETHPRGGSEKGENWYKAGYKLTKPNTWKDFIACGEYLVKNRYTSPQHLIGEGTSAGGILIGRAITERPDLFAAAISNVSGSNALRAENSPNGPDNVPEFGTVKDSAECMALYEMDAFQHVKEGTAYPAVICVAGMNDPRVSAWEPGKFAAALQNATSSGKPVLLKVNYDNGHFTEDKKVTFGNFASMYAFALWQAGHPDFQPK
ncbi:MAG: prolyl oligopeptidase family serine peptidase [Candidatus Zixiibacteriota bacterium]